MEDPAFYRFIGRRLRNRRRLLDLTQAEVGERCGVTFQQIQKYEAGMVALPIARLVALADALEAPIGHFIQGAAADGARASRVDGELADGHLA